MSTEHDSLGNIVVNEQGRVLSFSEALSRVGVGTEHLGRPWHDALPGIEEVRLADADNAASTAKAYRLTRGGETYDLAVHRQIHQHAQGGSFCIAVSRAAEREALTSLAFRLDKQATLADLVAGIAHEINNPLTFISGWLQLMLSDGDASGGTGIVDRETLHMLEQEVDRVARIVSNLLNFARPAQPA